jgi:hypothetical protein
MSDSGFDLTLAIWISDPARQGYHAIVRQDIAIQCEISASMRDAS